MTSRRVDLLHHESSIMISYTAGGFLIALGY